MASVKHLLSDLRTDLRGGLRLLRAQPGVTVVAVLSLALGLGLNVSIFSVVSGLLLEPLPVRDPQRIVSLYTSDFSGPPYGANAYVDLDDFRQQATALEGLAAFTIEPLNLEPGPPRSAGAGSGGAVGSIAVAGSSSSSGAGAGTREPVRVFAEVVSPEYFTVLGIGARAGRVFDRADAGTPGGAALAVLGDACWQGQFGGDPGVIGRSITLNGARFTVIGIAPPAFPGLQRGIATDLWIPATAEPLFSPGTDRLTNRGARSFSAVARLRGGASVEVARAQFRVIAQRQHAAHPDYWTDINGRPRRITVLDERASRLPPELSGLATGFLGLLLGLMLLVLLVACANVAGLLLARASARRREMAVRLALGAGRGRLIRQLLTESLLLAAASGLAALLIAAWAMALIASVRPPMALPILLPLAFDARVLTFALGLSLATGLAFGLAPALQASRPDVLPALKGHALVRRAHRRPTLRGTLVVLQVAGSLALLVVASLFARALQHAHQMPLGFNPDPVLTLSLDDGAREPAQSRALWTRVIERVEALPGVRSATLAQTMPLAVDTNRRHMRPEGYDPGRGEEMEIAFDRVAPRYFETLGIPLVAGREFAPTDAGRAPLVAIVNEAFAARYWPGQSPIGKGLSVTGPDGPFRPIVGVVRNSTFARLGQESAPMFYLPLTQESGQGAVLMIAASPAITANPASLAASAREAIRAIDPTVTIVDVQPMRDAIGVTLLPHRLAAMLLGSAGLLGIALAAIGLFGILAQLVAERTREIGIRMALGAARRDVLRLVVWHGVRLTLGGLLLGLVLAVPCARLASTYIFGVGPGDPLTFATVPVVLIAVACVASYLPARRAATIAPTDALRYD